MADGSYWLIFGSSSGENMQPAKSEVVVKEGESSRSPRNDDEAIKVCAEGRRVRGLPFHKIGAALGPVMVAVGVFAEAAPVVSETLQASAFRG